jgi:adenosylcobinamide-phosphate synthase
MAEFAGGILLVLVIVAATFTLMFEINGMLMDGIAAGGYQAAAAIGIMVLLSSTTIAVRGLTDSAREVISAVRAGHIHEARYSLSMIVGRDTDRLGDKAILRASIETLAENFSDGIVAPIFYFVLGGLPLAMAYKAVNTLDSMVGYRNEKYINFGKAAARLDDAANYIPARVSGVLIVLSVAACRLFMRANFSLMTGRVAFIMMVRDGRNHSSPNSGIPEAAMAGGLGVRLGGPSFYGGILVDKPYIGEETEADYLGAAETTLDVVAVASFFCLMAALPLLFLRGSI